MNQQYFKCHSIGCEAHT